MTAPGSDLGETLTTAPSARPAPTWPEQLTRDSGLPEDQRFVADDPAPPERIGRYLILDVLGRGGMGVVYAAYDPRLERKVALKVLGEGRVGGPDGHLRMLREAQVLARLSHPNVVAVFDAGEVDGTVFLAMDLIRGVTLREWSTTRRARDEILAMFMQAGQGLAAAHAIGLIHRDFKPDNVLVGDDGRARVVDFGLAALASADAAVDDGVSTGGGIQQLGSLTVVGAIMGTPAFMAPEQIRGATATPASDQFSLAVALWRALADEDPFPCDALDRRLAAIVERRAQSSAGARRLPRDLRRTLLRALEPDPGRRFPDLASLLTALQRARTAPRRRWIAAGLGLAGAAALTVGLLVPGAGPRGCTPADAAAATLWGADQSGRVLLALAAVDRPYAARTARWFVAELGRYASAWGELRASACESHARQAISDHLYDRQVACLHERSAGFAALVADVEARPAASLADALARRERLPPLEDCADLPRLAGEVRHSLATQAARDGLRRRLAAFEAASNDPSQAGDDAAAALEIEATALAAHDLVARARALRGMLADERGDLPASDAHMQGAWLASLTSGDAEAMADVAARLAGQLAAQRHRPVDGERWLRVAQAIVDRPAAIGESLQNYLLMTSGAIASQLGRHDEAIAILDRALARADTGRGGYKQVQLLQARSVAFIRAGRLAEGLADSQAALRGLEAAVGPDHPKLYFALQTLGITSDELGDFAGAQDYYRRAIALIERVYSPEDPRAGELHNNFGESLYRQGRHAEALAEFTRAAEVLSRTSGADDMVAVLARVGAANALVALGRGGEARRLYVAADAVLRAALPPGHPVLAYAHVGLGRVALAEGDAAAAIVEFEAGLGLRGADAAPGERAEAEAELARALLAAGREPERARELLRAAVGDYRAAGPGYAAALAASEASLRAIPP